MFICFGKNPKSITVSNIVKNFSLIGIICLFCILFVDKQLTLWIFQNIDKKTFTFFREISNIGNVRGWVLAIFFAFIMFWLLNKFHKNSQYKKTYAQWIIKLKSLIYLALLTSITVNLAKIIFGRYRPYELTNHPRFGFDFFKLHNDFFSFPSGHSATIFFVATAVTILYPNRFFKWCMYFLAVLVAVSRIIVNEHYLADIIMGGLIGYTYGIMLLKIIDNNNYKKL